MAPIIELPVSGNLGGGEMATQINLLNVRVNEATSIDVFQSYWHHFEFADLAWTKGRFTDAERFLIQCAQHDRVVFSTASDAAVALEQSGL